MTYYHASSVKDLKVLQPGISMHGKSWVYLTDKRENTLVYLCNAIEKYRWQIQHIDNENIHENLKRIILDEEHHVSIFKKLQKEFC